MENIKLGLLLMIVGMVTVFAILLIVINLGKALIALVNKYAPAEEKKKAKKIVSQAIEPTIAAAIAAAISLLTQGKGKVTKIEKI